MAIIIIIIIMYAKPRAYIIFPLNSSLCFQRLCRLLWGLNSQAGQSISGAGYENSAGCRRGPRPDITSGASLVQTGGFGD